VHFSNKSKRWRRSSRRSRYFYIITARGRRGEGDSGLPAVTDLSLRQQIEEKE